MDGKGRFKNNIFIERLWRTLKYERIYLKSYETGTELVQELTDLFSWYNERRKHTSLNKQTPDTVYYREALEPLNWQPGARNSNQIGILLILPLRLSHKTRPAQTYHEYEAKPVIKVVTC